MNIVRKETLKYVIEETMGDGIINIKVKFVYNTYIFGKLWSSKEIFDPIIFKSKEEASYYAKNVIAPSHKVTLSECSYGPDFYPVYNITDANAYFVYTIFDDALESLLCNYDNIVSDNKTHYVFLYVLGYMSPINNNFDDMHNTLDILYPENSERTYFSGFTIKNIMHRHSIIRNYYEHNWENIQSKKTLKEKFDEFSEYINNRIKKQLEKEREIRLSKTLVSTCETLINDHNDGISSNISNIINEYDLSRNKIIEDELKRVSDYQNFLKKLIR